jgi:hypothetical protein
MRNLSWYVYESVRLHEFDRRHVRGRESRMISSSEIFLSWIVPVLSDVACAFTKRTHLTLFSRYSRIMKSFYRDGSNLEPPEQSYDSRSGVGSPTMVFS